MFQQKTHMRFAMLALAMFIAPTQAHAATKWTFSSPYPDSYHISTARDFAKDVATRTNGEIQISVHANAELYKLPATKRAVQSGQLPLGDITLHAFENEDPLYGLFALPFLTTNKHEAHLLWQASKPSIEKLMTKQRLKLLYSCIWSSQSLFTRTPVEDLNDLKGQKFRIQGPTIARVAALMGVNGVEVQTADIPQAFLTGVISGMFTSDVTAHDLKAYDYIKYSYQVNAWHPINTVVMNARIWEKLDAKSKQALTEASKAAETQCWDRETDAKKEALEGLSAGGVNVLPGSDAMKKQLHEVGGQIVDEWVRTAGPEGAAIIKTYNELRNKK